MAEELLRFEGILLEKPCSECIDVQGKISKEHCWTCGNRRTVPSKEGKDLLKFLEKYDPR